MTQKKINDLRDRMIVALDVPTIWDAYRIVSQLGDEASRLTTSLINSLKPFLRRSRPPKKPRKPKKPSPPTPSDSRPDDAS